MTGLDLFDDLLPPDGMSAIIHAFPRLFRGEPPSIPGWVRPGWNGLVRDLLQKIDAELTDAEAADFHLVQVKEKYGTLRIYCQAPESSVRARIVPFIREAEKASETICDRCGKPGQLRDIDGWFSTLCDEHQASPDAAGPGTD